MFELLFSGFDPNKKRLKEVAGHSSASGPSTRKQNGPNDQFSSTMKSNNLFGQKPDLIGHGMVANLIYCLAISSLLLIQSGEAKPAELDSQVGKPCICNSTFYKVCPPARQCMENIIGNKPTTKNARYPFPPRAGDGFDDSGFNGNWSPDPTPDKDYYPVDDDGYDKDWYHQADPDHVPIENDPSPFDPPPRRIDDGYVSDDIPPLAPDLPGPIGIDPPDPVLESAEQGDKVVRHRKVYVKPQKVPKGDVPIHPIRIRIPISLPVYDEPELPAPPPLFKIKKYTTYETRPEIQMVPVTKTIIKPVGISPDQIIDETGGSYKKMFV